MQSNCKLKQRRPKEMYNQFVMSAKNEKSKRYHQGRWAFCEHQRFLNALEKYGKNWVQVQKKVKTRSLGQVRSHAQKMFMNMTVKDVEDLFYPDASEEQTYAHRDSKGRLRNRQMENEEIMTQKCSGDEKQNECVMTEKLNFSQVDYSPIPSLKVHDYSKNEAKKGMLEEALSQEENSIFSQSFFMEIMLRHKHHFLGDGNFFNLLKL